MIERSVKVETYLVHADCECGGEFKATGEALMCYPPKYIHECTGCKKIERWREQYPATRMIEVE
jgi:hypothetical protein